MVQASSYSNGPTTTTFPLRTRGRRRKRPFPTVSSLLVLCRGTARTAWDQRLFLIRRLSFFLGIGASLYFVVMVGTTTTIQSHHLYESTASSSSSSSLLSSSSSSLRQNGRPEPPSSSSFLCPIAKDATTQPSTPLASQRPTVSLEKASFRILCTSTNKKIQWGSYQLRCRDLAQWAHRCVANPNDLFIVTDLSFGDMQRRRWIRWWRGLLRPEEKIQYSATIFVKSFPSQRRLLPTYGTHLFVDLVDEYGYFGSTGNKGIPTEYHLIAQTPWQGHEIFPEHQTSVVEHWYNSYPADMERGDMDPIEVPVIEDDEIKSNNIGATILRLATVWNTRRSHDPTEGGCPPLSTKHIVANVTYECLDKEFDISKWYLKHILPQKGTGHKSPFSSLEEARCDMEETLRDPRLGQGKLYYNIFRNYDALVVLAKNHTDKLNYGNVQRTISQMRSGVPVLVEVRGRVLQDFMERYNYTCAFQRYLDGGRPSSSAWQTEYWTFDEAVEQLKKAEVRRKCQRQGLDIVRDYSPSKIGQKFLRTVGFKGDFIC